MDTDDPRILGTFVMIPKRKAAKLSQSNRSDHPMTSLQLAWWHATWAQFTDFWDSGRLLLGLSDARDNKSIGSTKTLHKNVFHEASRAADSRLQS